MSTNSDQTTTRRDFIKTSAILGGALMAPAILPSRSFAANGDTLKVGLIGCGGRGTGAAGEALKADTNVVLTAVGDVFEDRMKTSLGELAKQSPDKVKVAPDHQFIGLDAYQKVIDSGVDVVILATPPGFRPQHLKAAVAAGKHIFCEKPVATDGPGIRSAMESVAEAKKKNLALVAGFCWRYDAPARGLFERVLDGKIGDVVAVYGTYFTGPVKAMRPASERPAGSTDLEWTLRNWMNFSWLSGDSIVEQAVHAVDWMCWANKDVPPIKVIAVGGRQIPQAGGNIFDHFEVNYEYANGTRGFIGSRQQAGCMGNNTATIFGTKGRGYEMAFSGKPNRIEGENEWTFTGPKPYMYQVEHNEMFASIRAGKPINNGDRLVSSTLAAIMGRMAAYTGQEISWEQALNSKEALVPADIKWDMPLAVTPIPMPGQTQFI